MALQTEVPCVKPAVEKLKELAHRMRSTDFNFHDDDVLNIDMVIDALHELENETKRMHDVLEIETIKASILRHKLHHLPAKIKAEIMEAVNSARQSNATSQMELHEALAIINSNILSFGNRQQQLEKENSVLQPEREQIRQQHEEIISQLNQRMAEKASMQIALNETRDKVRMANQDIVNLEDGILQLKEDLIQERTEARQEKRRLKKAVTTTVEKTKLQKEENLGKKKELDALLEKYGSTEGKLAAIRKSVRRFESSKSRLEDQCRNVKQELEREEEFKEDLLKQNADIVLEKEKEEKEFHEIKVQLKTRIHKLEDDITISTDHNYELEIRKSEIQLEYKDKLADLHEVSCKVAVHDKMLKTLQDSLLETSEEIGQYQTEIKDMDELLDELEESHQIVVTQLNKQIQELRELLAKERKERIHFQSQKENVQKSLEDTKAHEQKCIQSINNDIQNGKTKHVELSNEGSHLQKKLKNDESEITELQAKLDALRNEYDTISTSMQSKTTALDTEITEMEKTLENKRQLLEEKTPLFAELEVRNNEHTADFNLLKKNVAVLKSQKVTLENTIIKERGQIKKHTDPVEQLKQDITVKREEALNQLKTIGKITQEMEENIYKEGCKLKTVLLNNDQFEEACRKLEADLVELRKQMVQNELIKLQLNKELKAAKEQLMESWKADKVMQERFTERDNQTIDEFGEVYKKADCRSIKLCDVTDHLRTELKILSAFLENVSKRRPKEEPMTRLSSRNQTTPHPVDAVAEANTVLNLSHRSGFSRKSAVKSQQSARINSPDFPKSP